MRYDGQARLWVLVTDGHRARIVVPDRAEGHFRTMMWLGVAEPPHYPPAPAHRGLPARVSPFAAEIAGRLNDAGAADEFEELILVAPPEIAHDLRAALRGPAAARLVGTLARSDVALDDAALSASLARWWLPSVGGAGRSDLYAPEAPAA